VRRWAAEGRLRTTRTRGRQRLVPLAEITRLQAARRRERSATPSPATSARNRFEGIVTRVERDRVAAELGLKVGDRAACVVKATNVVVEVARRGRASS